MPAADVTSYSIHYTKLYDVERLQDRLDMEAVARRLMPASFTLTDLQRACEAILSEPIDKRNFRKKLKALDLLEPTGQLRRDGPHRPAQLYRVKRSA